MNSNNVPNRNTHKMTFCHIEIMMFNPEPIRVNQSALKRQAGEVALSLPELM
jgi:hypothetical protein